MPGLGRIILAALLAEVWQPPRGRDYHALRSLSGGGPGDPPQRKTSVVMRRYACNKRLANDADDRQRKAKAAEPSGWRACWSIPGASGSLHHTPSRNVGAIATTSPLR